MNTLVIHPKDFSTRFLSRVYEDLDDMTLVTGQVSRPDLIRMIDQHDRIMMMGHGTHLGLLSVGQFDHHIDNQYGYVIDGGFADQLAERDNSVFIWCNADQYVNWNGLNGFYTGMFVSELSEARMMRLPMSVTQRDIDESNDLFVDVVGRFASTGPRLMHAAAKHEYSSIAQRNPVAKYNNDRLYLNSGIAERYGAGYTPEDTPQERAPAQPKVESRKFSLIDPDRDTVEEMLDSVSLALLHKRLTYRGVAH